MRRDVPGNIYHEGPNGIAAHSNYNTVTAASSSTVSTSQLLTGIVTEGILTNDLTIRKRGPLPPTAGSGFCHQRQPQELYHNQEAQPPTVYRDSRRHAHSYRGQQQQRHSTMTTTTPAEFDFSTMSSAGTSLAHPSSPPSGRVSEDDYFVSIAEDGSVIKPIPVSEL